MHTIMHHISQLAVIHQYSVIGLEFDV